MPTTDRSQIGDRINHHQDRLISPSAFRRMKPSANAERKLKYAENIILLHLIYSL